MLNTWSRRVIPEYRVCKINWKSGPGICHRKREMISSRVLISIERQFCNFYTFEILPFFFRVNPIKKLTTSSNCEKELDKFLLIFSLFFFSPSKKDSNYKNLIGLKISISITDNCDSIHELKTAILKKEKKRKKILDFIKFHSSFFPIVELIKIYLSNSYTSFPNSLPRAILAVRESDPNESSLDPSSTRSILPPFPAWA